VNLKFGDIQIEVMFKNIKKLHLSVYPPFGTVKLSAPMGTTEETLRAFALMNLSWIKKEQRKLKEQEREQEREYLHLESHYVWGKRYRLEIIETETTPAIELTHSRFIMKVRPGTDASKRKELLNSWYREQIRQTVPELIAKYSPRLNVSVDRLFVQDMKTLWGSCNSEDKNIRLNTALARKPIEYLEYIVLHEMIHLLEPKHSEKFYALMDQMMPNWRRFQTGLNQSVLPQLQPRYSLI
jgi:predicted metal-dependent hydrolase